MNLPSIFGKPWCHRGTSHAASDISCALTFGFFCSNIQCQMSKFGRTSPGERVDEGAAQLLLAGRLCLIAEFLPFRVLSFIYFAFVFYLCYSLSDLDQVRRIKTVRAMTRSRSNSISSIASSSTATSNNRLQSAMARSQMPPPAKTLKERVKCILLGGEKGNGLPDYGFGYAAGRGSKTQKRVHAKGKGMQKQENPVARLKLLLVRLFHS